MSYLVVSSAAAASFILFFYKEHNFYLFILELEGEKEKHSFVVLPIYTFTGWSFWVPGPEITPATLMYQDNELPGQGLVVPPSFFELCLEIRICIVQRKHCGGMFSLQWSIWRHWLSVPHYFGHLWEASHLRDLSQWSLLASVPQNLKNPAARG